MKTLDDVKKTCYFSHTATRRGYVSRLGDGIIKPYKGTYGAGFIHIRPRWDTSQYVYYDYYIVKDGGQNVNK